MSILRILSLLLITHLMGHQAQADMRYRWKILQADAEFTVEIRDKQTLRLSLDKDFYLLSQADGLYAVIDDRVLDLRAFNEQLRDLWLVNYFGDRMQKRIWRVPHKDALVDRGEQVQYANLDARRVYADVTEPKSGEILRQELVISDDSRMLYLKEVLRLFSQRNMKNLSGTGFELMNQAMFNAVPKDQAIVRYANRIELAELEELDLPDERFQLPIEAKIRHRPSLADLGTTARLVLPLAVE
jgi:hypothetical protein